MYNVCLYGCIQFFELTYIAAHAPVQTSAGCHFRIETLFLETVTKYIDTNLNY